MSEIIADPPDPSCYSCSLWTRILYGPGFFMDPEPKNFNRLILIPLCLARAGASPGEAPAILARAGATCAARLRTQWATRCRDYIGIAGQSAMAARTLWHDDA